MTARKVSRASSARCTGVGSRADNQAVLRVGLGLIAGPDQDVPGKGLRERKKRLTRKLLSDTATRMFVARGSDEVTIADIAAACGVSEKTAWNYFPAKETLLLDVEDATVDAVRREIGTGAPPVEAMPRVLDRDLQYTTDQLTADLPGATLVIQRFSELVDSVPALRNYHRGMMEVYRGDPIDQPALQEIFKAVIANNRAGGWRRIQRSST